MEPSDGCWTTAWEELVVGLDGWDTGAAGAELWTGAAGAGVGEGAGAAVAGALATAVGVWAGAVRCFGAAA